MVQGRLLPEARPADSLRPQGGGPGENDPDTGGREPDTDVGQRSYVLPAHLFVGRCRGRQWADGDFELGRDGGAGLEADERRPARRR